MTNFASVIDTIQDVPVATLDDKRVPDAGRWRKTVGANREAAQELIDQLRTRDQSLNMEPKELSPDDLVRWFSAVHHHRNQTRKSGEPYTVHLWGVAKLAVEYGFTEHLLISILLAHDVIEDSRDLPHGYDIFFDLRSETGSTTPDETISAINTTIRDRIDSVSKPKPKDNDAYLRKLLESMLKDGRSILVKLFDRLHNMMTIEHMTEEARTRIATETMEIFVPIAKHLKMYKLQEELVRLCLKVLNPRLLEEFDKYVEEKLTEFNSASQEFRSELETKLREQLQGQHITIEVTPHLLVSKLDRVHGKAVTDISCTDLNLPEYENFTTINVIVEDDDAAKEVGKIIRELIPNSTLIENDAHGVSRGRMLKPSHPELGKLFIRVNTRAEEVNTPRGQFNGYTDIVVSDDLKAQIKEALKRSEDEGLKLTEVVRLEFLAPKSLITVMYKDASVKKSERVELNANATVREIIYKFGGDKSVKIYKVASTAESQWETHKIECNPDEQIIHGYTYVIKKF